MFNNNYKRDNTKRKQVKKNKTKKDKAKTKKVVNKKIVKKDVVKKKVTAKKADNVVVNINKPERNNQYYHDLWEKNFKLLLEYRDIYSHINVPAKEIHKVIPEWERKLGKWCGTQRQFYKNGWLSEYRINKLNSIGFNFSLNRSIFESHFNDLLKFKEKYGHLVVPLKCDDFPSLGPWVAAIRNKKIPTERKKRLNSIGFVWDVLEANWQRRYQEVKEYKKKHGTFRIADRKKLINLHSWMIRMRTAKRYGRTDELSEERIKLLDDIGFNWNPREISWEMKKQKLLEFKEEFGHCNVPSNYRKIKGLGYIVTRIRADKSKLSKDKVDWLNSIGFEWDGRLATKKRRKNNLEEKIQKGKKK